MPCCWPSTFQTRSRRSSRPNRAAILNGHSVAADTYAEPGRAIPVIADVDVLVVGGGPAGVGAAVGAARTGTSVFLVEEMGALGGMWTQGLVITLAGYNSWLRPHR